MTEKIAELLKKIKQVLLADDEVYRIYANYAQQKEQKNNEEKLRETISSWTDTEHRRRSN